MIVRLGTTAASAAARAAASAGRYGPALHTQRFCSWTLRSTLLGCLLGAMVLRGINLDTFGSSSSSSSSKASKPGRRSIAVHQTGEIRRSAAVRGGRGDGNHRAGDTSAPDRTSAGSAIPIPRRPSVEWLSFAEDFPGGKVYGACWYMNVSTFLKVDTGPDTVVDREAAVVAAFRGRYPLLRMSLDYLDLSVEHLSRWWRWMDVLGDAEAHAVAVDSYTAYIARQVHRQLPFPYRLLGKSENVTKPLHPTVALIAFSQTKAHAGLPPEAAERAFSLTTTSLGVTVASLVQLGVGRIVVVGSDPSDEAVVHDAFQLLEGAENLDQVYFHEGTVTQVYDTQLAFVLVQGHLLHSALYPNNIPRATLAGLQLALLGSDPDWTRRWLGDEPPQYWKYVYYTEADSILQTRPSMIPHLKLQLDAGLILNPHRFEVALYDGDVPVRDKVPVNFKTPIVVHSDELVEPGPGIFQHCCGSPDASNSNRPAITNYPSCGDSWYRCGFSNGDRDFSRLEPYDFIVLSHGSGTTTIASTEQGRRCIPSTVPCRRGTSSPAEE